MFTTDVINFNMFGVESHGAILASIGFDTDMFGLNVMKNVLYFAIFGVAFAAKDLTLMFFIRDYPSLAFTPSFFLSGILKHCKNQANLALSLAILFSSLCLPLV